MVDETEHSQRVPLKHTHVWPPMSRTKWQVDKTGLCTFVEMLEKLSYGQTVVFIVRFQKRKGGRAVVHFLPH